MDNELQEFWKKCLILEKNENDYYWWYDNDDNLVCAGYERLPDLTLDNLFKYAVPKLKELGYACRVQSSPLRDNDTGKTIFRWHCYASVFYVRFDNIYSRNYDAFDEKPEHALYQALRKVLL